MGGGHSRVTVQALGRQRGATSDGGHDRGDQEEGGQRLQPHDTERVLGVARSLGGSFPASYAASIPFSAEQTEFLDPTTLAPATEEAGQGQASTAVLAGATHRTATAGAVAGAVPPVGPVTPLTWLRGAPPEVARSAASAPAPSNPGVSGAHPPRAPTQSAPTANGQAPRRIMPTSISTSTRTATVTGYPQSADTSRTLATSHSHQRPQQSGALQQTSARTRPLTQAIQQSRRDRALQLQAVLSEPLGPSHDATAVHARASPERRPGTRQAQAYATQTSLKLRPSGTPAAAPAVGKPVSQSGEGGRRQGSRGQATVPSALVWVLEKLPVLPASAAELPGSSPGAPRRHSETDLNSTRWASEDMGSWGHVEFANRDTRSLLREQRKLERSESVERRPLFSTALKGGAYSIFKGFFAPIERWGPVDWMIVGAVAACAVHAAGHSLGFFH